MCECSKIGDGAQLFRIRQPEKYFTEISDIGADHNNSISSRKVLKCNNCGQIFALMSIPYKDEEEIIVRAPNNDWNSWNWVNLSKVADRVRWRGPNKDPEYII